LQTSSSASVLLRELSPITRVSLLGSANPGRLDGELHQKRDVTSRRTTTAAVVTTVGTAVATATATVAIAGRNGAPAPMGWLSRLLGVDVGRIGVNAIGARLGRTGDGGAACDLPPSTGYVEGGCGPPVCGLRSFCCSFVPMLDAGATRLDAFADCVVPAAPRRATYSVPCCSSKFDDWLRVQPRRPCSS
jgi:hypothetical protein